MSGLTDDDIVFAGDQQQTIYHWVAGLVTSRWYSYSPEISHLRLLIVVQELAVGCEFDVIGILARTDARTLRQTGFNFASVAGLITVTIGAWSVVPAGPNPVVHVTLPGCHTPQSKAHSRLDYPALFISSTTGMAAAWEAEYEAVPCTSGERPRMRNPNGNLANLANILMLNLNTTGSLAWPTATISVVIISRLILNLHTAASLDPDGGPAHSTQLGTLQFAHSAGADHETSVL
ncbi:hypothetical protein B0H19DRAFT_1066559 [Mycena capillaripes]|nr:hypothetical protein B0H19DRAFT_1066559 [Mycena capillaripes]